MSGEAMMQAMWERANDEEDVCLHVSVVRYHLKCLEEMAVAKGIHDFSWRTIEIQRALNKLSLEWREMLREPLTGGDQC